MLLMILAAALIALPANQVGPVAPASMQVNPVVGDQSFQARFGRPPTPADSEDLRLRTHLEHVLDQLRGRDVSAWPREQQRARAATLADLAFYIDRGEFPRNFDLPGRRPCFIDRDGNICAVGYLVEASAGRDVAEAINRDYQYASIAQIDLPLLDEWLTAAGLTRLEAAMIQPFYNHVSASVEGGGGHALAVPDGTGPTLASLGHVITVVITDEFGGPIVGFPWQDIFVYDISGPDLVQPCNGGTAADANTNAAGETTISGALGAGGWSEDVCVTVGFADFVPVPLQINSPDLDGDGMVALDDIGQFAADFSSGSYYFRSDLNGDGTLGLHDVGAMAAHVGASCN